jgi:hypothetical protein
MIEVNSFVHGMGNRECRIQDPGSRIQDPEYILAFITLDLLIWIMLLPAPESGKFISVI